LHFAKTRGARVVAITDSAMSPIAQLADDCLLAHSDMATIVDSLVAPMSLINALIVTLGQRRHEQLYETLVSLETIWDEYQVYENIGEVYDKK